MARSPDEQTYTRQANIIVENGFAGFTQLSDELAADPVHVGQYPSPLRAGYLGLLVGYMNLTDERSVLAGAQLSLLCGLLSLPLLALLARRALSPLCATLATLFYAVLPFELTTSRRAWQDSVISFLAIVILALAFEIVRNPAWLRIPKFAAFVLFGILAATIKENLLILFVLCGAGVIAVLLAQRQRGLALVAAICTAAATLLGFVVLASIFGGPARFVALERLAIQFSAAGVYDLQFSTGPAWMFPAGLLRASPAVSVGALVGAIVAVSRAWRGRSIAAAGVPFALALISCAMLLVQIASKRYDFRYTAPADGAICLLAAFGASRSLQWLDEMLIPLGRIAAWAILAFAIAVAALRDINFARDVLLNTGMQDLALRPVLGIPPVQVSQDLKQ